MDAMTVFLVAVSLALDALSVAVTYGAVAADLRKRDALLIGMFFGSFQFIMPLAGYLLGGTLGDFAESYDHWVAFGLLLLIGVNMIAETCKRETKKSVRVVLSVKALTLAAIATSIDALAVGVSFSVLNVNLWFAAAVIGCVAFILSFAGAILGRRIGCAFGRHTTFAGGCALILIGTKILAEHLA